jgi:LAO/AO transport system kinase
VSSGLDAKLVAAFDAGEMRALAKMLSLAEARDEKLFRFLQERAASRGGARVFGLTGVPGAGKSTLVDRLLATVRSRGARAAVLAVDPVSPYTGGALLGDRIRLQRHFNDPGVFIRSLSTRGRLGGLSAATRQAVHVCEAFQMPYVFLETVGVGQSEVDVRHHADVTAVLLTPEWGDGVQAIKAGILEIGDLFFVNKADRPGSDRVVKELKEALSFLERSDVPVVAIEAQREDTGELAFRTLEDRYAALAPLRAKRREEAAQRTLRELVEDRVLRDVRRWLDARRDGGDPYGAYLEFLKTYRPEAGGLERGER